MLNAHSVSKSPFAARGFALTAFLLLISFALSVAAAPRVVWKRTKLDELDKAWKVAIEVHLDRAPDVAHVPVRFSFTPTVYFERALVDGKKDAVTRQVPLQNQQPIIESVDVSFLDPGSGKTATRTRFTFQVTRDRGFEAGQYQVKVTDARSGKDLGGATSVTLNGDNPVVDRRSVVFDDKPKPEKSKDAPPPEPEKELSPEDDAFWAGGPKGDATEKSDPLPPPAHMREKPGCGCRVGAPASGATGLGFSALALVLLARRVRRSA